MTLLSYFNNEIKPLVDELDEKLAEEQDAYHDNCLICQSITSAIKHPTLEESLTVEECL